MAIQSIEELIKKHKEYNPKLNIKRIKKAWEFSKDAHTGQKRLTGEDFVLHPLQVADTLTYWKLDEDSIVAALLHDTIEDGAATRTDIVEKFGGHVALLVDGVTKVTNVRLRGSKETEFVETLRKMILVMAKDIRVVLLKLADRLHNMETLHALPKKRQKVNAIETLEIYAPLAERLGMGEIKGLLQDLSFPYAYPKEYKEILKSSKKHYAHAEKNLKQVRNKLNVKIKDENIKADLKGRKKHLYSLWKKLQRPSIAGDYDKVNDIIAFRIIVKNIRECYEVLGVVHTNYKPVPNMTLSDFISQPKPNGYQSLHTKVFASGSGIVEIQIRTKKMHAEAEYGAAAHWAYSEKKSAGASDTDLDKEGANIKSDKNWVKQLVTWHEEINDSKNFLEAVKLDAFNTRILVFSPKGDVYDLPEGATPVDYAFAVHTNLPNYIGSIHINGKIASLDSRLSNGDVVEIRKFKNKREVKKDWLNFVVSKSARFSIRKQLRLNRN